jgi:hypothetical protein
MRATPRLRRPLSRRGKSVEAKCLSALRGKPSAPRSRRISPLCRTRRRQQTPSPRQF